MRLSKFSKAFFLCVLVLFCLCASVPVSMAVTYYLSVDVPSMLDTTDYRPYEIVRSIDAVYSLQLTLDTSVAIGALHRQTSTIWLFSPAHPVNLGGTEYEPRDVVSYNGSAYSMFLDGSTAGIPDYARIDALFLDASNNPVVSFDVPVNISSTEYSQSDLVLYNAGFLLFWDAETAGVPSYANLVGAARDSAEVLVVSFDVPVTLGTTEYLPGQLVQWSGSAFSSYFVDSQWPANAHLHDFSFEAAGPAGQIPDGRFVPGTPLTAAKATGGQITLTWSASCLTSDTDYEIYEGTIGTYYSHASKYCTTSGATTRTFVPAAASSYYLVVPANITNEGSYGRNSSGSQRPQGSTACLPQILGTCP